MNTIKNKQKQLNEACKLATGGGVAWQGVINKDGTVTLRREEKFAIAKEINFESLEAARARLEE